MLLYQLISPDVPVIAPTDTTDYMESLFFASKQQQLPVVEDNRYLGILDVKDLALFQEQEGVTIANYYERFKPAIQLSAHPFEALRLLHIHDLDILPVLNDTNEYVGSLCKNALLHYIIESVNIDVNGGILILEMDPRDYTLAQIARICENEQVLVLGVQAKVNKETDKLEVTIKTNSTDLSAVVQAFERYEYTVLDTFGDQSLDNDISDRYRLLMNYINM